MDSLTRNTFDRLSELVDLVNRVSECVLNLIDLINRLRGLLPFGGMKSEVLQITHTDTWFAFASGRQEAWRMATHIRLMLHRQTWKVMWVWKRGPPVPLRVLACWSICLWQLSLVKDWRGNLILVQFRSRHTYLPWWYDDGLMLVSWLYIWCLSNDGIGWSRSRPWCQAILVLWVISGAVAGRRYPSPSAGAWWIARCVRLFGKLICSITCFYGLPLCIVQFDRLLMSCYSRIHTLAAISVLSVSTKKSVADYVMTLTTFCAAQDNKTFN